MEGQVALRLPAAKAIGDFAGKLHTGCDTKTAGVSSGCDTLVVTVLSEAGEIDAMAVGDQEVKGRAAPGRQAGRRFQKRQQPVDQVVVRSSPNLRYGELMRVVEVCGQQRLADGNRLERLSFVELGDAADK